MLRRTRERRSKAPEYGDFLASEPVISEQITKTIWLARSSVKDVKFILYLLLSF